MTGERCFVDSNVLVYLFDDNFPAKQSRARELIAECSGDLVLSVQVLGEFFHVVTRKIRRPLAPEQALRAADHLGHLEVWPVHRILVRKAMERRIASKLSYWDCLIVETAIEVAGDRAADEKTCSMARVFGDLRVWNPFLPVAQ